MRALSMWATVEPGSGTQDDNSVLPGPRQASRRSVGPAEGTLVGTGPWEPETDPWACLTNGTVSPHPQPSAVLLPLNPERHLWEQVGRLPWLSPLSGLGRRPALGGWLQRTHAKETGSVCLPTCGTCPRGRGGHKRFSVSCFAAGRSWINEHFSLEINKQLFCFPAFSPSSRIHVLWAGRGGEVDNSLLSSLSVLPFWLTLALYWRPWAW